MTEATTPKQKLTGKQWIILITICALYFFAPTFGAVSSTLSLMPDYYGVTPAQVSWISALANPLSCVAGLCVGAFVGKKMSYRLCAILASALFVVFGGLPFLWQSIPFEMLLVSRALFGLGCGCFAPLVQSVITHLFESETARSAWIGIINIIFSIGASAGSMITGALAMGGTWQNAYAFYLFCIIPFVLVVLFFRDSEFIKEDARTTQDEKESKPKEKRSIPAVAIMFIVLFCTSTLMTQTFFNYAGIAMAESGCDTLLIGTVFTVFTVAGIVIAALNAALWKALRLWNFPIAIGLIAFSYVLCLVGYNAGSVVWFFAASIVMGVGCCVAGMVMPMVMSVTCTAGALTLAIGLQEVARNLGSFLSAPWLQGIGAMFGDTAVVQFTATLIFGVVVTVLCCILAAKYNKRFKDVEMEKK